MGLANHSKESMAASPFSMNKANQPKKNINMQKQKGVVLFWPWAYTIEELEKNELGRKLGFNVIKIL